jgi:hypothetical protein
MIPRLSDGHAVEFADALVEDPDGDDVHGATREVLRLVPTTWNPAAASASVAALPMPEDAPVTSATGRAAAIMAPRLWDYDRTIMSSREQGLPKIKL